MFDDKYILALHPKSAYEQQIKWEISTHFRTTNERIVDKCKEELAYWQSQGKPVPQKELEPAPPLTEKQEEWLRTVKEDAEFIKKQYDEGKWIPKIANPTTFRIV